MASSNRRRTSQITGVYRQEKWIPGKTPKTSIQGKTSDDPSHELQVLRQFDLNWKYGPCINITRLERWDRAYKLGLQPPKVVKEMILNHLGDRNYTECVWSKYAGLT
ncbi:DNA polymerase delta subunit 4-like [Ischnura elegans]|uniref:DNA polymerase delta subunit 4-like n=1 Tax=Ischnura elegans TaxID=197161 RepID=UPI001ED8AD8D|nr:DNA polymerase delta subunit 4-like [Ischnura elegans]